VFVVLCRSRASHTFLYITSCSCYSCRVFFIATKFYDLLVDPDVTLLYVYSCLTLRSVTEASTSFSSGIRLNHTADLEAYVIFAINVLCRCNCAVVLPDISAVSVIIVGTYKTCILDSSHILKIKQNYAVS